MISDKMLLAKLKPYMVEDQRASILGLLVTVIPFALAIALMMRTEITLLKMIAWAFCSLLNVRLFVLYHDYCHNAIFRDQPLIGRFLRLYGLSTLIPYSIWCESHNAHHKNNSKMNKAHGGQIIVVDLATWRGFSRTYKILYVLLRQPFAALTGYLTSFFLTALSYFVAKPMRHFMGLVAIALHFGLLYAVYRIAGAENAIYFYTSLLASACIGTFLFLSQHTFPAARYLNDKDWSMVQASLQTTSYFKMGPLMNWFTANIGYHHIHHLSTRIPYYRLPQVFKEVPELQSPHVVTWHPRDVWGVMAAAALWDEEQQRMISFHEYFLRRRVKARNRTLLKPQQSA